MTALAVAVGLWAGSLVAVAWLWLLNQREAREAQRPPPVPGLERLQDLEERLAKLELASRWNREAA